MCITYHYGWVSARSDGSGGKRVESGTGVELLGAEVVGAITQTTADRAALIPAEGKNNKQEVSADNYILKKLA